MTAIVLIGEILVVAVVVAVVCEVVKIVVMEEAIVVSMLWKMERMTFSCVSIGHPTFSAEISIRLSLRFLMKPLEAILNDLKTVEMPN
jgi:hypothetical protein